MTPVSRVVFWSFLTVGLIAAASAVAIAQTTRGNVGALLFTTVWSVSFALGQRFVPQWWHQAAELVITDRRVLWKRGPHRRSIERAGISFARIHWYPGQNVGDLELVRDIPTGALGRKLRVLFRGVEAPDRVWDHIRGAASLPTTPLPRLEPEPAGQRLSSGERVIGFFRPTLSWRQYVPTTVRTSGALGLGLLAALATINAISHAIPAAKLVLRAGVPALSAGFIALVLALSLTTALLLATGVSLVWTAVLARAARDHDTRYLVTDRRVVITQGQDELQIDRSRIVDVVEAPVRDGGDGTDVFLVLDGPRAKAMAVSGAFGEADASEELRPVLRRVADPESVRLLLLSRAA
jgi:hypothetical protein